MGAQSAASAVCRGSSVIGCAGPLLAPEIVFVIAGKDFNPAIADLEDAGSQLVDEVAIMGDENHRAVVLLQRLQQHVFSAQIEVVGRLVEQQEVRRMQQHAGQSVAVALAARKHAYRLEHVVFGEKEAAQNAT